MISLNMVENITLGCYYLVAGFILGWFSALVSNFVLEKREEEEDSNETSKEQKREKRPRQKKH